MSVFHINFDPFNVDLSDTCIIEIQLNTIITRRFPTPVMFAKQQFGQIVQQLIQHPEPGKVTCYYDDYVKNGKIIKNSLVFENNLFVEKFSS